MDYGETPAHASATTAANPPAAGPVKGPRQRPLDFAGAEASHAERRHWLGLALLAASADLHLATLCRLVFDATHGGALEETAARTVDRLAARPWGLCCGVTKARATIARAVAAGLLAVEQTYQSTGARGPNAYRIDWDSIRQTLGLPRGGLDGAPVLHTPQKGPCAVRGGTPRGAQGAPSRCAGGPMGGGEEFPEPNPGPGTDLRPQPPAPSPDRPEICVHGHGKSKNLNTMDHGTMEAAAGLTGDLADVLARIGSRPAPATPPPAAAALAQALQPAAAGDVDPAGRKARIVARILEAVADPDFHPSIAGRAADLVTVHGLPPRDLLHILDDLAAMRATGRLTNPGGFFLTKARALAARHGLPWPNPRKDKPR